MDLHLLIMAPFSCTQHAAEKVTAHVSQRHFSSPSTRENIDFSHSAAPCQAGDSDNNFRRWHGKMAPDGGKWLAGRIQTGSVDAGITTSVLSDVRLSPTRMPAHYDSEGADDWPMRTVSNDPIFLRPSFNVTQFVPPRGTNDTVPRFGRLLASRSRLPARFDMGFLEVSSYAY